MSCLFCTLFSSENKKNSLTCLQPCPHLARNTKWHYSEYRVIVMSKADTLAKESKSITLREAITGRKAKHNSKWMQENPQHNKKDPYHLLLQQKQLIIFRLRNRHNRMKNHLFNKLQIGEAALCLYKAANQTTGTSAAGLYLTYWSPFQLLEGDHTPCDPVL